MESPATSRPLLITADETTGALESAAGLADLGRGCVVVPLQLAARLAQRDDCDSLVIDLRSRHEPVHVAAERIGRVLADVPHIRAHKIDSTLRGNWPAEIEAAVSAGRRVLLVPAYPSAGRACSGGVVTEHGVPVDQTAHALDVRAPVLTSRPATLLDGAVELSSPARVARWLAGSGRVAVADAADDEQLSEVVGLACAAGDVLLVGTAAVIAAVGSCLGRAGGGQLVSEHATPSIVAPVLVVCGSLHAASRAQVDALMRAGAVTMNRRAAASSDAVVVLMSPPDRDGHPTNVAGDLAHRAHEAIRARQVSTVVLLGGDTAEAFIGERVVRVHGSLGVGVASGTIDIDGRAVTVIAKPGAFGAANTLVDLMAHLLHRANADD